MESYDKLRDQVSRGNGDNRELRVHVLRLIDRVAGLTSQVDQMQRTMALLEAHGLNPGWLAEASDCVRKFQDQLTRAEVIEAYKQDLAHQARQENQRLETQARLEAQRTARRVLLVHRVLMLCFGVVGAVLGIVSQWLGIWG